MAPRTRARGRRPISYKEDVSSSEPSEQDKASSSSSNEAPIQKSRPKPSSQVKRNTLSVSHKRKAPSSGHNSRSTRTKKSRHSIVSVEPEKDIDAVLRLGGKVPPWQSLPYHVLADIFYYASHHLWHSNFEVPACATWLLKSARICRAFAEPAISALYYSPNLGSQSQAQAFIEHLTFQTEDSTFNYRAKVKYLNIDVNKILAHKLKGRDHIELPDFLKLTPQLRGLNLDLLSGWPDGRVAYFSSGATSMDQKLVFKALHTHKISLEEFYYSGGLMGFYRPSHFIETNPNCYLQSLKVLTLKDYAESTSTEEFLADGLKNLPRLRNLNFISSNIVNEKLLPLLPCNLEQFTISSCASITSEILSTFLATHGGCLQLLILDRNRKLNLSFLAELGHFCSKLQTLRVDLTFYSSGFHPWEGVHPKSYVILGDETPTWPLSLEKLELFHLRNWNLGIAERFFSSLVDSAVALPNLRHLNIKASLEESGWRDRVRFRDRWTAKLLAVFLRVPEPPNPFLRSINSFEEHKRRLEVSGRDFSAKYMSDPKVLISLSSGMRHDRPNKFGHLSTKKEFIKESSGSPSDRDAPLTTMRRSNRLRNNANEQTGRSINGLSSTRHARQGNESNKDSSSERSGTENDVLYAAPKAPSTSHRRTRRRKKRSDEDSSSDDSAINDDAGKEMSKTEVPKDVEHVHHVQGLCDVVRIVIDNLRPAEVWLNEDDFLDEERSGDEDWNDNDQEPEEEAVYAW